MMSTLNQRLSALLNLGEKLSNLDTEEIIDICQRAEQDNPWFTHKNIIQAFEAIKSKFLNEGALLSLIQTYSLDDNIRPVKLGIVAAGNLPMVSFHDILCAYLVGHQILFKCSDKDKVLMPWIINELLQWHDLTPAPITIVDRLQDYQAVIATGSNTSAKHFKQYFGHVPHLIRQSRNSVAVLTGRESKSELSALANDCFDYFGLGCRNVSKIYIPRGLDPTILFEAFHDYKEVIHHNKFKNNFDYNVALNLLNQEPFLQGDFFILKESPILFSRIACLHYEAYADIHDVFRWLENHAEEIQCIVCHEALEGKLTVHPGMTQCPQIDDFADNVDTIQFLLGVDVS